MIQNIYIYQFHLWIATIIFYFVSSKPTIWGPATCCWSPGRNAHLWTKTRSEMWTTGTSWWQMHHQMPPPPSTHTILKPSVYCLHLTKILGFSFLQKTDATLVRLHVWMEAARCFQRAEQISAWRCRLHRLGKDTGAICDITEGAGTFVMSQRAHFHCEDKRVKTQAGLHFSVVFRQSDFLASC